jgi:hypothetical protein
MDILVSYWWGYLRNRSIAPFLTVPTELIGFHHMNIKIAVVTAIAGGAGAGLVAGLMHNSTIYRLHSPTLIAVDAIATGAIILSIGFGLNARINRNLRRKTEELREEGILPDKAVESDADVIRLCNEDMREPAALCYWSLHGGTIEQARQLVGMDPDKSTKVLLLSIMLICCVIGIVAGFSIVRTQPVMLLANLVTFACVFFAIFTSWRSEKERARINRETLAAGKLPDTLAQRFAQRRKR